MRGRPCRRRCSPSEVQTFELSAVVTPAVALKVGFELRLLPLLVVQTWSDDVPCYRR